MTDERISDLFEAIDALPRGAGIVFRHHATPPTRRRALFDAVLPRARRRRLILLLADTPRIARAWRADGAHHRSAFVSLGIRSVAVHNRREMIAARRAFADIVFVSPVFTTRSHATGRPLGRARLGLVAGSQRDKVVAMGGMTARRFRTLATLKLHGWAAIDGLSYQKRNAVPT